MRRAVFLLIILFQMGAVARVFAQDSQSVASPDGRIEFHLGVIQPPDYSEFLRIGYSVLADGKEVIATSYLGYWIHDQEPLLGENVGLSESQRGRGEGYNWILGEFLQNGSLGRRINVEARVYNDRVAFRCIIPRSTPLDDAVVDTEETEFRFADPVSLPSHADVPFITQTGGGKWVGISETNAGNYPSLSLFRQDAKTFLADVAIPKKGLPLGSSSSLVSAWRVIAVGPGESIVRAALRAAAP